MTPTREQVKEAIDFYSNIENQKDTSLEIASKHIDVLVAVARAYVDGELVRAKSEDELFKWIGRLDKDILADIGISRQHKLATAIIEEIKR